MDVRDKLKDLNMTEDEIRRLARAMKDDKFKELLHDYARELSDPDNKRRYEEEITLMEQERGNHVDFIHPTPFAALRTSVDGQRKCYVNICSSEKVAKPSWSGGAAADGRRGQSWSLPHTLHPARPDADARGRAFTTYDVVFHPDALRMAAADPRFMEMVESTALRGLQDSFKVKLDTENVRRMKSKYKGVPQPCLVRKPIPGFKPRDPAEDPFPFQYPDEKPPPKPAGAPSKEPAHLHNNLQCQQPSAEEAKEPTRPRYTVKYRSFIDLQDFRYARDSATTPRPKEIVVTVELPLLRSAADAELEVKERSLLLESRQPNYRLRLELAYAVDQDEGRATFDKQRRRLTVTLPVLPSQEALRFGHAEEHQEEEKQEKASNDHKGHEQEQEPAGAEAESQRAQIGQKSGKEEPEGQNIQQIYGQKVQEEAEGRIQAAEGEDEGPNSHQTQSEEAEGHSRNHIHHGLVEGEAGEEDEGPQNDQMHKEIAEEEAEDQKARTGQRSGKEEPEGQNIKQIHGQKVQENAEGEDEGPNNHQTQSEEAEGHSSNHIHHGLVEGEAGAKTHEEEDGGPQNDQIHQEIAKEEAKDQKAKTRQEEPGGQNIKQIHGETVQEEAEGRIDAAEDEEEGPNDDQTQSEEAEGHRSNHIHHGIVEGEAGEEDEGPQNDQIRQEIAEEEAEAQKAKTGQEEPEGQNIKQIHGKIVQEEEAEGQCFDQTHAQEEGDEGPNNDRTQSQEAEGHSSNQIHEGTLEEEAKGLQSGIKGQNAQIGPKSGEEEAEGQNMEQIHSDSEDQGHVEVFETNNVETQSEGLHSTKMDEEEGEEQPDEGLKNDPMREQSEEEHLTVDSPAGGGSQVEAGALHAPTGGEAPGAEGTRGGEERRRTDPEPVEEPAEAAAVLREVDADGNVTVISDHRTSAGFVFQSSLIEELD